MRGHLVECFRTERITQFPTIETIKNDYVEIWKLITLLNYYIVCANFLNLL